MYECMYVGRYVYMCVSTFVGVYVSMYVCMYVCTYVRMYVRMYVCMYVAIYVCMCIYIVHSYNYRSSRFFMFLLCEFFSAVFFYKLYPVYPVVIILCNYETRNPFFKKMPSTLTKASAYPDSQNCSFS